MKNTFLSHKKHVFYLHLHIELAISILVKILEPHFKRIYNLRSNKTPWKEISNILKEEGLIINANKTRTYYFRLLNKYENLIATKAEEAELLMKLEKLGVLESGEINVSPVSKELEKPKKEKKEDWQDRILRERASKKEESLFSDDEDIEDLVSQYDD